MREWKPIDTIPENDLVITFSPKWGIDFCRKIKGQFYVGDGPIYSEFPTHWMPLPQPPQT